MTEFEHKLKAANRAVHRAMYDRSVRKATVYDSPSLVAKATRLFRPRKNGRGESIIVTIGKPNFAERRFIRLALKAGEPFPVRKVQVKYWPKK